jgi:hypothetical protein
VLVDTASIRCAAPREDLLRAGLFPLGPPSRSSSSQGWLEAALIEIIPGWTMAPVVEAFQAMRGVQVMTAVRWPPRRAIFVALTIHVS